MDVRIIVLVFCAVACKCEIIKIKSGSIEGTTATTRGGRTYNAFYGIPYAAPPVGELRWKDPKEPIPWEGVRNASVKPPMCIQSAPLRIRDAPAKGQEDCLYINVFTPVINNSTTYLPVIVYIHGGAFQYGQGSNFGPQYLLDKDVLFVTFNYRLGSLGFLSMGNSVLSGNYGLKDQNFALKWVKENIAAFGGNPNQVTLMGESAGSASVHLHFFSPLSKGLFQRAIMESGSALSTWSYYDEIHAKATGTAFAILNGCFYSNAHVVLECLRKIPAETISRKENLLTVWRSEPSIVFKPTVEKRTKNGFLPNAPGKDTYVTKDIPILTGINSGEGAFKVVQYVSGDGELVKTINKRYIQLLPYILQYFFTAEPARIDETTKKIKKFYFGDQDIGRDTDLKFVNLITDALFTFSLHKNVVSNTGKRYMYLYDHRAAFSGQDFFNYSRDLGVCHGDEVPLLMFKPYVDPHLSAADRNVSLRLVNYWTNFAIHEDPNGLNDEKIWKAVSSEDVEYLHIKTDSDTMESNLWSERVKFWESLPVGR